MAWRQHLPCKVVVSNGDDAYVWCRQLPSPQEIPLAELFVHNFPESSRDHTLAHRKVIWTYKKIQARVWKEAGLDLFSWLAGLPNSHDPQLIVDAHEAGAAVMLALITHHPPLRKQLVIRVHQAPLDWLREHFAFRSHQRIRLEHIEDLRPQSHPKKLTKRHAA